MPRSAVKVDSDSEFTLFAVTTFKKHSQEFIHKCREQKWTPRDFSFKEGGREEERKELEKVRKEERQLWGEILRLARINWGEAVMAWVHVLVLRVFVETVLRYGLPLSFVSGLVLVSGLELIGVISIDNLADDSEAGKESTNKFGPVVLLPCGECAQSRQEGPGD